jgi:hypothetical protein
LTSPTSDVKAAEADEAYRWRRLYFALDVLLIPFLIVNLNVPQSFTGYSIAAAFFLHLCARYRPAEWLAAALVGLVLNQCASFASSLLHLPSRAPHFSLAMLGAGSLTILGWCVLGAKGIELPNLQRTYLTAVILLALVLVSQLMLLVTGVRDPTVFDAYLQVFDLGLAWPPVFIVGRWFQQIRYAFYFAKIIYSMLPIVVAILCGGYIRYRKSPPWQVLKLMAIAGLFGYAGYFLFPAVGPVYVPSFKFPMVAFSLSDVAASHSLLLFVPNTIARNAMPSLHMAWALLLWINAAHLPRAFRALSLIYVFLTVIVVLGLGEHYIVDLVVAIPFAVLVQAVGSRMTLSPPARWGSAIASALLVALWLILLRFGSAIWVMSPLVPWACLIASTALSVKLLTPWLKSESESVRGYAHDAASAHVLNSD